MPQAGHGYCLYPVQKSLPSTPGQKQHGQHKEAVRARAVPSHLPSLATAASPLPQPDQGIRAVKAEAEPVAIPLCCLVCSGTRPSNEAVESPASLTDQLASLARPSAPAAPALRRGCDGT